MLACKTDFWYDLTIKLQKEGYVLVYEVVASTMSGGVYRRRKNGQ